MSDEDSEPTPHEQAEIMEEGAGDAYEDTETANVRTYRSVLLHH